MSEQWTTQGREKGDGFEYPKTKLSNKQVVVDGSQQGVPASELPKTVNPPATSNAFGALDPEPDAEPEAKPTATSKVAGSNPFDALNDA